MTPEPIDAVRRRYGWVASIYNWANLEGLLYADARERAIELLDLRPGARVLDVACGTGANFALIEQRIGPSGDLVGVDVTPQMLDQAGARVARAWSNVRLREGDVCEREAARLGGPFDAAVCTLGLSVIPQWQRAWEAMVSAVRPGGRLAIMDAGYPDGDGRRGDALVPRPLAWALSRLFAADCSRRGWRLLQRDTLAPTSERFTWSWVTAAAGAKAPA
jgi:ubiquinone/menaquinone biosynthesis C-methylase UbiE